MTLIDAVKTCLKKYITFSGRASRGEFWKFVLGIFLALIAASVANALIFGPVTQTQFTVQTTSEGTRQFINTKTAYGPGPISNLLQLAVLLPFLAAATRRLHDIGRPGWHLLFPMSLSILLNLATLFLFQVEMPVAAALRAAAPGIGDTISVPQPPLPFLMISLLAGLASFVLAIVWLARKGQAEANRFGPDPLAEA